MTITPFTYIASIYARAANYALGAVGISMQYGYAGLFNLSTIGFSAIGAYTAAILTVNFNTDFITNIIIAVLVGAIVSILLGIPSLKSKGDYFAVVTLGFTAVVYSFLLGYTDEPIRGSLGIAGIPAPSILGFSFNSFELLALLSTLLLVVVLLISHLIANSHYGRILRAIKEDEDAAISLGKNTEKYKLGIFVIGNIFCVLSGVMYAYWARYVDPKPFFVMDAVFLLFAVLLGGKGNTIGAVLGAFLYMLLPEALTFVGLPPQYIGSIRQLLFGLLLLIVIIYKPEGILPQKTKHYKTKSELT